MRKGIYNIQCGSDESVIMKEYMKASIRWKREMMKLIGIYVKKQVM
jgi:hypothetical protein